MGAVISMTISDAELVKVSDPVFPNPVYAFGGLISQICRVKIAAEEQSKTQRFH